VGLVRLAELKHDGGTEKRIYHVAHSGTVVMGYGR
jgi:hypothetical protein